MLQFISSIIIVAILSPLIIADNACSFTDSTKGNIDISSLSGTGGTAAYKDLNPTQGSANYKYSFNPCKPFSEGQTCVNVAVCQVSQDGSLTFILGRQDSATWDSGTSTGFNPTVSYSYSDPSSGQKNVEVEMLCTHDLSAKIEAVGETGTGFYQFKLSGKCACWNGCSGSGPLPPPSGGGSGFPAGAIFIIILVALAVVYFTVFALINRFGRHQSGLDLIAHRTFWVAVPVYAKDGVVYLFRRVTGKDGLEYRSL